MEGIIAIIIIVISLITSANKAKQVKQNAPGQSTVQRPEPVQQTDRPGQQQTHRPAQSMPSASGTFWKQVSASQNASGNGSQRPVSAGHQAAGRMPEGISRECEHGSVGGSIAYSAHSEGTAAREKRIVSAPAKAEPLQRPVMSAEEMRRAVIMAEILKRPQERMLEQSRRWNAR